MIDIHSLNIYRQQLKNIHTPLSTLLLQPSSCYLSTHHCWVQLRQLWQQTPTAVRDSISTRLIRVMSVKGKESPLPPLDTDVSSIPLESSPNAQYASPQVVVAVTKKSVWWVVDEAFGTTEGKILVLSTILKVLLFPA